jgi:hypothetical protein
MTRPEPGDDAPGSPTFPWFAFLAGAAAGGLIASSLGGVLGALAGGLGAWLLRRPWPVPARWAAALAAWVLGLVLLWIGAGFVHAVRGLLGGGL